MREFAPVAQQTDGRPPWVACDPKASGLLPDCDRLAQHRPQTRHFSFAAFRTSAQDFRLRSAISRAGSHLVD
jgi:hypothetical protein